MMIEISELLPHEDRANMIKKCFAVLQDVLEAPDQKPEQRRRTAETILRYLLPRARQPGIKTQEVAKENKKITKNADKLFFITSAFISTARHMVESAFQCRETPESLAKTQAEIKKVIEDYWQERKEAYGEIRAFAKPRNPAAASP